MCQKVLIIIYQFSLLTNAYQYFTNLEENEVYNLINFMVTRLIWFPQCDVNFWFVLTLPNYPETIKDFTGKEWELIVSDPGIIKIVKVLMEQFSSGKNLDKVEEFLDNDATKGEFRKISLLRPPYTQEFVGQAISEFIEKIARIKISESYKIASASGDLEALNNLIREKRTLCKIKINPS